MKMSSQLQPPSLNTTRQVFALESEFAGLSRGFKGQLLLPHDADYESARRIWNGMIDRWPAVIARCVVEEDVCRAVRFARRLGLLD